LLARQVSLGAIQFLLQFGQLRTLLAGGWRDKSFQGLVQLSATHGYSNLCLFQPAVGCCGFLCPEPFYGR